jgi:hypothetical protein
LCPGWPLAPGPGSGSSTSVAPTPPVVAREGGVGVSPWREQIRRGAVAARVDPARSTVPTPDVDLRTGSAVGLCPFLFFIYNSIFADGHCARLEKS